MFLTAREFQIMSQSPAALRAVADYHDNQAAEADAMDCAESSNFHDKRRKELIAEADLIEASLDAGRGYPPTTAELPPVAEDIREFPEQAKRVEDGAIRFGTDWPGTFLRGDTSFHYAMMLKAYVEGHRGPFADLALKGLADTLSRSRL